jgi:glyoxylase-like metal-dependent hydrolase (beta-lactamase superfamily II)
MTIVYSIGVQQNTMIDEIAANLYRIEIPLPKNPLRSINSYAIKDSDRNLIIDTGMNRKECLDVLEDGLKNLGIDMGKADFFVTHLHVDHLGLVSDLRTHRSAVYLNQADADRFRRIRYGTLWEDNLRYTGMNGFSDQELQEVYPIHPAQMYGIKKEVPFEFLKDGDVLRIGDYLFRCVETPGHSKGHTCLYEPNRKILVSGDHILRDITPTVSSRSDEENPLKEYLASLDKVSALDVDLVLPGHRENFRDCKERIEELKRHHQDRLAEILSILENEGKNAYQVASRMHWDVTYESWDLFPVLQKWFAVGEALSHLKYLEEEGKVRKEIKEQKITYSLT